MKKTTATLVLLALVVGIVLVSKASKSFADFQENQKATYAEILSW